MARIRFEDNGGELTYLAVFPVEYAGEGTFEYCHFVATRISPADWECAIEFSSEETSDIKDELTSCGSLLFMPSDTQLTSHRDLDTSSEGNEVDISSRSGQFEFLNGIDLEGTDIDVLRNIKAIECIQACFGQEECTSFTYNKITDWCFLKSGEVSRGAYSSALSGIKGDGVR